MSNHRETCPECGTTFEPDLAHPYDDALARVDELKAAIDGLETGLQRMYEIGGTATRALVAVICDEHLDRSGAMLGRIRAVASARKRATNA